MYLFRSLLATSWLSILFLCVTAAPIGRPQAQSFDLDQHLSPRFIHPWGLLRPLVEHLTKMPGVEKPAVVKAYKQAMRQMFKMNNLPGKDKKYMLHGKQIYDHKDAIAAVATSLTLQHLNLQVGHGKYPHVFQNRPYPATHPDPTLAGKTPIPATHEVLHIHPVKQGGKYLGGKPGAGRIVISGKDFHGIVTHDNSRLGKKGDHFPMEERNR
ncbi:hypothetical protein BJ912DRAFT_276298 [Pholiota molesta]|nr:hypothetical protein BJ912DRAFT_276298 [Pholiota molesta]